MLIAWILGPVSLFGWTNAWHNHRPGRKLILHSPPLIACGHCTVFWATFRVCMAHWFKIVVYLQWEMCKIQLYTFEYMPVVLYPADMWIIFNPTIIVMHEVELREAGLQGSWWLESFDFEVVLFMPQKLIYPRFHLLATWLSLLKVVCWSNKIPWIPLFKVLAMLCVQSSCVAICFPARMFYSNYLPMSLCMCCIRSTCPIRILGVYSFLVGNIFRWRRTWHIVCG